MRPGADWCTLCFADLRPVPPPRLAPAQPTGAGTAPAAAAGSPVVVPAAALRAVDALAPCTVCETPMPLTAQTCAACGSGLLDGLRSASGPTLRLPLIGDLMRFGRGARAAIVLALTMAVVVAVLLPFVLFA